MKNRFYLNLILCLFTGVAFAQNSNLMFNQVKGSITNDYYNKIENVTVTIYNSQSMYQTLTDSNGNYSFAQIPFGNYKISYIKNNLKGENDTLIISNKTDLLVRNKTLGNLYYSTNCHFYTNTSYGNIIPNFVPPSITYINKAPNQNPNAIAAYMRGVDSRNGETPSIKGARPENTAYYIDGVRVAGIEENYSIIGK